MKNIQTGFLKFIVLVGVFFVSFYTDAQEKNSMLTHADSLFKGKQYTQSFDLYQELLKTKRYTPAMLLKMAFIQEGLGNPGLALYHLNLYYLASGDSQVLSKMTELANKNKLAGYDQPNTIQWTYLMEKYSPAVTCGLAALVIVMLALSIYQKRKGNKPITAGIITLILIVMMGVNANLPVKHSAIIAQSRTFLMDGPSAGANVIGMVSDGHRLTILDKKDVWLKVKWMDKDAYVKENQIMSIAL